jgi:predicted transcriptional regulator
MEENTMSAIKAIPMSVKLQPDTCERMKALAEIRQRTIHWLMCEAINQYIDREEKREAFRQDTIKAWDEYQETGLHVTSEEVETWLSSWGTKNELPAPICHK